MNRTKIQVKDFNFHYGTNQVLKNISMNIEKNLVTALIGPSGCGKSTFLRSINRMNDLIPGVKPEGTLLVNANDVNHKETDVVDLRRKVGMVFQKSNPFPTSIAEKQ